MKPLLVVQAGRLASPTLAARDGDSQVTLTWTAIEGATSYLIRYGSEPNFPSQSIEVGNITSTRVTDLVNGIPYYFTVSARSNLGYGLSLPSNEAGITPFGDNQPVSLVAWDFAGRDGDASFAPTTIASSRVSSSVLARGDRFQPAGWAPNDCFLGASDTWAQTLSAAVANNHFVQFTLTPNNNRSASLATLQFRPSFQNLFGGDSDPRGAGIAWRVGNNNFSAAIPAAGVRSPSFNNGALWEFPLNNIAELQNTTAPITFRIYFHGMGPYEGAALGGPGNDIAVIGSLRTPALVLWREQNGLDPAGADDAATPANDNIPNVVKYAFGFEPISTPVTQRYPTNPTAAGLPNVRLNGADIDFQLRRRRATTAPGVTYTIRASADLNAWQTLIQPTVTEILNADWELATFRLPVNTAPRYFQVRVSVIN